MLQSLIFLPVAIVVLGFGVFSAAFFRRRLRRYTSSIRSCVINNGLLQVRGPCVRLPLNCLSTCATGAQVQAQPSLWFKPHARANSLWGYHRHLRYSPAGYCGVIEVL
uniref:Putative secreted protein n=1 Tax=Ixodes ricinus TaxID=34613 RepID=A0A6B0UH79_IXORI